VLLQLGELRRIERERTRLRGFDETMRAAGIDVDILIDMFDSTYELFDCIQTVIEGGIKTETVLMEAMNSEGESSCILYHFKVGGIHNSQGKCHRPARKLTSCSA
jgi:hypothetical protein